MSQQRRITICPEGWAYVLVLVLLFSLAILREGNLLLLVAGSLAGPILLGWRMTVRTLRDLRVDRRAARAICAGDLLVVEVEVTNRRRRMPSWAVIVEDRIVPETGRARTSLVRPQAFFGYVPAGGACRTAYRTRITQRGRYKLGPMQLLTRFPFGFFCHSVSLESTETVTVMPRLGRLAPGWTHQQRHAFEGARRPQYTYSRGAGDFYGVREWRPGESRRWVHWRSSARHGSLVVRQFEQHRELDVSVLVDLWQPEKPEVKDLENVELAVSFAATVAADVCRQGGSRLLLGIAAAETECLAGAGSTPMRQQAMERLAVATASSQIDLSTLLESVRPRLSIDTDLVLVTTRSVDLKRSGPLAGLLQDPSQQPVVRRLRVVDTSDWKLAEIFQPE